MSAHFTPQSEAWTTGSSTTSCLLTTLAMQQFLAVKNTAVIPHLPYSPDWAPYNVLLFPKMKIKLKERILNTVNMVQEESQAVLNTLRKDDLGKTFQSWERCWDHCLCSNGEYFEDDGGNKLWNKLIFFTNIIFVS